MLSHYTCHPIVIKKILEREILLMNKHFYSFKNRKIAIFTAGIYAQRFYNRLKTKYNVDAEFFIDNDIKYSEKVFKVCGKDILYKPWETKSDFTNKYFVIIATKASWVKEISIQLDNIGIPNISSYAYEILLLWDDIKNISNSLYDDYSKAVYFGLIWYWLTLDTSFQQLSDNIYFDTDEFIFSYSEIIADLGAHVGGNIENYIRRSDGSNKIYAFEPDVNNYKALKLRINRLILEWNLNQNNLIAINAGVGIKTGYQFFTNDLELSASSHFSTLGKNKVMVYSLDDYFKDKIPPSLIKADIEGFELDMIQGAINIIKNHKPKIAISIYHNIDDIITIPRMIKDINSNYNFVIHKHNIEQYDTILYCF